MFERFTPDARQVVVDAQAHARRRGTGWIGCEHILLAVAGSETVPGTLLCDHGAGADAVEARIDALIGSGRVDADESVALASLGIDLDQVREAVESRFGPGALDGRCDSRRGRGRFRGRFRLRRARPGGPSVHPPFTPRAKRCLELALREALKLRHRHIGPEHIALALLARDDTMAARILADLRVDKGVLRQDLLRSIRQSA